MSYIGNLKKNSALSKFIKILEYQQNQTNPPRQIKNRNTNKFNCL